MKITRIHITILCLFSLFSHLAVAQRAADPNPTRFAEAIEEFANDDAENFFGKGGIVFVGSSSIRRLNISEVFPGLMALNRGFGGSQISDVNHYIEETVLQYEPAITVMYCGSNDLWARKPAQQVIEDFREFTQQLFERVPEGKLLVLASRPSPKRAAIFETELAFNYLLEMEAIQDPRIIFLRGACDRFFDEKGEFHLELFDDDLLHMSDQGYQVWNEIITPHLK